MPFVSIIGTALGTRIAILRLVLFLLFLLARLALVVIGDLLIVQVIGI
jgi:hypothetical protein